MEVKKGDTIQVHYKGTLEDGSIFDQSYDREPLEFVAGIGQMIPGFDSAVLGMKIDEEKKVIIPSDDAYGIYDDQLVNEFSNEALPENFTPEKGIIMSLQDQNGNQMQGVITHIHDENIVIDFNHPLAGKDLTFDIKVLSITQ